MGGVNKKKDTTTHTCTKTQAHTHRHTHVNRKQHAHAQPCTRAYAQRMISQVCTYTPAYIYTHVEAMYTRNKRTSRLTHLAE